ncbi:cation transporter [Candidatus Methylopumilus universalis]|jgi:Co/Zn/Cd efflux system component|uniref:cation transporter n=1 Tax=Candidatus Methylopumilus universalis TaxID=2588536 RepID=UPI001123D0B0|nr:cation transporter [Candidatus Methylopumilus universalis]QDC78809.1 cation transporter [Candidatus Methylopumilus universalis]QDC90438.1 cation transporter [Candidatus Methylopumilus universalis]
MTLQHKQDAQFAKSVLFVAFANLTYFFVEFIAANTINSSSLFADSIDFLEDASINILIFLALGWSIKSKARLGKCLAMILVIPALAFLYTIWQKFNMPSVPDPSILSLTGFGALLVNLTCTFILMRFRNYQGSLTRAAFLSARNDALANIGIIIAGLIGYIWVSMWPDLIVGFLIMAINLDAAKEIWEASESHEIPLKP